MVLGWSEAVTPQLTGLALFPWLCCLSLPCLNLCAHLAYFVNGGKHLSCISSREEGERGRGACSALPPDSESRESRRDHVMQCRHLTVILPLVALWLPSLRVWMDLQAWRGRPPLLGTTLPGRTRVLAHTTQLPAIRDDECSSWWDQI